MAFPAPASRDRAGRDHRRQPVDRRAGDRPGELGSGGARGLYRDPLAGPPPPPPPPPPRLIAGVHRGDPKPRRRGRRILFVHIVPHLVPTNAGLGDAGHRHQRCCWRRRSAFPRPSASSRRGRAGATSSRRARPTSPRGRRGWCSSPARRSCWLALSFNLGRRRPARPLDPTQRGRSEGASPVFSPSGWARRC